MKKQDTYFDDQRGHVPIDQYRQLLAELHPVVTAGPACQIHTPDFSQSDSWACPECGQILIVKKDKTQQ